MKQQKAEKILRDPGRYAHHDRIFSSCRLATSGNLPQVGELSQ